VGHGGKVIGPQTSKLGDFQISRVLNGGPPRKTSGVVYTCLVENNQEYTSLGVNSIVVGGVERGLVDGTLSMGLDFESNQYGGDTNTIIKRAG